MERVVDRRVVTLLERYWFEVRIRGFLGVSEIYESEAK